jgi:uncharacterized integral membrane protein
MTGQESGNRRSFFPLAGYLLILLLLLPVTVFAQDPVDLMFGATGAFPWSITGILPGDHGSDVIELHNNGTENGIVYIWVDNIRQSDRQGNAGGGLWNYVYFNVSHPRLNSTVILPAHITAFPTAPLLPTYIIIDPFIAGDTIRLNWTWEFAETGQPQNDAQGNTLRFNISYTLVNLTAPLLPTTIPTEAPTGTGRGGSIQLSAGPSGFRGGEIQGLNPAQRPQLQAPPQEPMEIEESQPVLPDHWFIVVVALILLVLVAILYFRRQKHS